MFLKVQVVYEDQNITYPMHVGDGRMTVKWLSEYPCFRNIGELASSVVKGVVALVPLSRDTTSNSSHLGKSPRLRARDHQQVLQTSSMPLRDNFIGES